MGRKKKSGQGPDGDKIGDQDKKPNQSKPGPSGDAQRGQQEQNREQLQKQETQKKKQQTQDVKQKGPSEQMGFQTYRGPTDQSVSLQQPQGAWSTKQSQPQGERGSKSGQTQQQQTSEQWRGKPAQQQGERGSKSGQTQLQPTSEQWRSKPVQQQGERGGKSGQTQQQPSFQQSQGAWGGKQTQTQGERSGKSGQTQQQRPFQQPQGAWGGKQAQPQAERGGNSGQTQQQSPFQQPQGAWGGKQAQPQAERGGNSGQTQQPQGAWGGKQAQPQAERGGNSGQTQQQSQRDIGQQKHRQQETSLQSNQPNQGAGRGRGRGQQTPMGQHAMGDAPRQQPELSPSTLSVTQGLSELQIQPKTSSKSSSKTSIPQRYDVSLARGTRGRPIRIETNYLELMLNKMIDYAYQYDIKFEPDKPKRFLRGAFISYCIAVGIPAGALAFDGKANVYSPKKLLPKFVTTHEVIVIEPETSQEKKYKVTLMETQDPEIELKSLKSYQKDRIFDKPMRALQCLDVVLSSPCHQKGVRGGRSFYNPPPGNEHIDLTESYELWLGLFQAAVLGDRPFLNIDISHRAFPSAEPVMRVILSLGGNNPPNLHNELTTWLINALHDYLRGLIVIYKPPACFNNVPLKRYKYQAIKLSSSRQNFTIDDPKNTKITVEKYFRDKGYQLKYPNLPCIHVGNSIKTNYIPVEFLEIAPGQINLKKAGPRQVQKMIRYAATDTGTRKQKIIKQFQFMDHNSDKTLKSFQVGVGSEFLKIDARVLNAPSLEYNRNMKVAPRCGSWNGMDYIKSADILEWAVLIADNRLNEEAGIKFAREILNGGRSLKMNISDKFNVIKSERVADELRAFKQKNKSIVFVILSARVPNLYARVKQNAELNFGVLTQCIKTETVERRLNRATVQNILLKVNAKLNGLNHRIHSDTATIIMKNKNVMFIGADVTHPTPDQRFIPSVVGVAASHDLDGFQYNMQWCLQEPTKEIIVHMEQITLRHLNFYEKVNKKLPETIIYYRDGVSEGQFPDITNIELRAMDGAFSKKKTGYRPKLTCLIVQKRHHTRFFPQKNDSVGKYYNVPPGTCVDQTIVHPNECQFFLVSHESIQGTAKPTKYSVLRDDSQFNIDDLQAITYNMCHMFTRCNRSVSYPAPAYYAHHVASRGKIYIDGEKLNMNELQKETNKREIKNEIIGLHPMFFV